MEKEIDDIFTNKIKLFQERSTFIGYFKVKNEEKVNEKKKR